MIKKDLISRQEAIGIIQNLYPGIPRVPWLRKDWQERYEPYINAEKAIRTLPSAQPEPFADADKLKRCRFEYINACKIVAHPTPDTSKNDIYDAYAVMKALHPIFGDAEF